ncbi:MAG: VCBS repeat-containing protein [bacterium]
MENFLPGGKQEDWGYQVQESSNDVVLTLTGESRFFPGEEIQISNPATGDVWQFTTRVNSDSPGFFEYSETQTSPRMGSYTLSALGDFNNDRHLDYLLSETWDDPRHRRNREALELILGQSGDSLTADQLSSAQTIDEWNREWNVFDWVDVPYVTTGDFNGDGSLDFITGIAGGNHVYLNDADGQRFTKLQLSDLPESSGSSKGFGLAGDFDGDGHLDYLDYRKGVFLNKNGRGTFTLPPRALPNPGEEWGIEGLKSAQIGDIDRDGDLDIVDISAGVFLNRIGTGSFGDSPIPLPEVGASDLRGALVLGDFFDNDGFLDILVAETGDNPQFRFWKWQQDSLSYNSSIDLSVDESSLWEYDLATVVKGDFNGDGKLDLATPTKLTDKGGELRFPPEMKIAIWLNEDGHFSGEPLLISSDSTEAEAGHFFVGDLDSDGDLDIVANSSTGLLSFWHNSPDRVELAVDRINNAGSDNEIELNSEDYAALGISGALGWGEGILDQINQRISDSNGTVLDKGRIEKIAAAVTGEYVACEPGFGSDYGECKICKAGYAGHGSEGCQPCEGMFVASQEGSSACEACPIGQVPDKRHRSCRDNPCEEGKYWDVLANQCRKDAKVAHRWVQMMLWDASNRRRGGSFDVETHDSLNGLYGTLAGFVGETQEDSIDLDSELVRQATIHSCVSGSPIKESLSVGNDASLGIYGHGRWLTRKDQSNIHNEWSSRAYEFPFDLQNYHKKAFPEVTNAEKLYDLNATDERAESIARCDTLNIAQGDTELDWQKGKVLTHTNRAASSSMPIYLRGLLRRATKAQVREQNKKGRPEKAVFALNISGHGNGFRSASMDLPTIRRIIHEEIGGVELLSFDSCLMGNYESLLLLDGVAKWVFGASHQILIEGSFNFSDETAVEKLLFNAITERSNSGKAMSTKQYVKQLTQYALSAEAKGFYSYNAFDMEKFPPFRESFDTVLRYLADNMAENYQTLSELHADDYWVLQDEAKVKYSVKKFLKTLKKSGGQILSSHAANALQNLDELMLKKKSDPSPDVQSHLELINNYSVGLEDTVPTREDYQALGINEAVGWSDDRLESVNAEILDGKKARQAGESVYVAGKKMTRINGLNERLVQKIVLKTVGRSVEMAFAWYPTHLRAKIGLDWAALSPLRDFNMAWEDAQ